MIFLICPVFPYALMEPCQVSGALEFWCRMQKKRILLKFSCFTQDLEGIQFSFPISLTLSP